MHIVRVNNENIYIKVHFSATVINTVQPTVLTTDYRFDNR